VRKRVSGRNGLGCEISRIFDEEDLLLQNLIFPKEVSFQFMTRDLIPINTKRNGPFHL
jgi:hypothetical protein